MISLHFLFLFLTRDVHGLCDRRHAEEGEQEEGEDAAEGEGGRHGDGIGRGNAL